MKDTPAAGTPPGPGTGPAPGPGTGATPGPGTGATPGPGTGATPGPGMGAAPGVGSASAGDGAGISLPVVSLLSVLTTRSSRCADGPGPALGDKHTNTNHRSKRRAHDHTPPAESQSRVTLRIRRAPRPPSDQGARIVILIQLRTSARTEAYQQNRPRPFLFRQTSASRTRLTSGCRSESRPPAAP